MSIVLHLGRGRRAVEVAEGLHLARSTIYRVAKRFAARGIHVIVDNYCIHSSRQTQLALARLPRLRLLFLPPYCPELNALERVWLDRHAEVTRNHRCATIDELLDEVRDDLNCRNQARLRRRSREVA